MGKLTTHVLDTAHGRPAAGMQITLYRLRDSVEGMMPAVPGDKLLSLPLNADGRANAPLLEGANLVRGRYRLVFGVAAYFRELNTVLPDPPFIDEVPLEFGIADPAMHYHVPLLVSPWSYSTYRGS